MDRTTKNEEFSLIRRSLLINKCWNDHIRYILIQTNNEIEILQQFMFTSVSLDSILKNSSEAEDFLQILRESYYSMNIRESRFVKLGNNYPNIKINQLPPTSNSRIQCDNFFKFLEEKVRESFRDENSSLEFFFFQKISRLENLKPIPYHLLPTEGIEN